MPFVSFMFLQNPNGSWCSSMKIRPLHVAVDARKLEWQDADIMA